MGSGRSADAHIAAARSFQCLHEFFLQPPYGPHYGQCRHIAARSTVRCKTLDYYPFAVNSNSADLR